jgi:dihydroflavonol-4-reductase
MQQGDLCLVPGGSGFLATWIEKYLIEAGYRVRGTVRSLKDTEKLQTLQALLPGVEFVEADLSNEDCWAAAVEDCKWIFHVATPQAVKEETDRVGGAVAGAAVAYGHPRTKTEISEDDWTDTEVVHEDYLRSKALAEQAAWAIARDPALNPRNVPLSTVCPSLILGPSLVPWGRYSLKLLKDIADGTQPVLPDMTLHVVDVRDCARMHIAVMNSGVTDRHRHFSFGAVGKTVDLGLLVREQYKGQGLKPTTRVMPNALMWLLRFVSQDVAGIYSRIGVHFPYTTRYPGVYAYEYTSLPDMVHTSMESMIDHKWIVLQPQKKC